MSEDTNGTGPADCRRPGCPGKIVEPSSYFCSKVCRMMQRAHYRLVRAIDVAETKALRTNKTADVSRYATQLEALEQAMRAWSNYRTTLGGRS